MEHKTTGTDFHLHPNSQLLGRPELLTKNFDFWHWLCFSVNTVSRKCTTTPILLPAATAPTLGRAQKMQDGVFWAGNAHQPEDVPASSVCPSGEMEIITAALWHLFRDRAPLPGQTAPVTAPLIFAQTWHQSSQELKNNLPISCLPGFLPWTTATAGS